MAASPDPQRFAYLAVADGLRADITAAVFGAPGERIPSIRHLAERFTVSAQTVQKALALLAEEGVVRAGSTRGYFVAASPRVAVKTDSQRLADVEGELRRLSKRLRRVEDELRTGGRGDA